MKPRHKEQKQVLEHAPVKAQRRFQIEKLEERIAPCSYKYRGHNYHYPGRCGGQIHR